jgi:hypothetical protein
MFSNVAIACSLVLLLLCYLLEVQGVYTISIFGYLIGTGGSSSSEQAILPREATSDDSSERAGGTRQGEAAGEAQGETRNGET